MATIEAIIREIEPKTQIQNLLTELKTFRTTFLEKTCVKGRCILPDSLVQIFGPAWSGYCNIEIRYSGNSIRTGDPYECIVQKSDGSWAGWNLNDVVSLEDYERFIFNCWSYDDGQALDAKEVDDLCMIGWGVKPEVCTILEEMAQDIDALLLPLTQINSCRELIRKISKVIRAGNSTWQPYRVRWTFIKELDDVIKELEIAGEQDSTYFELN